MEVPERLAALEERVAALILAVDRIRDQLSQLAAGRPTWAVAVYISAVSSLAAGVITALIIRGGR